MAVGDLPVGAAFRTRAAGYVGTILAVRATEVECFLTRGGRTRRAFLHRGVRVHAGIAREVTFARSSRSYAIPKSWRAGMEPYYIPVECLG